MSDAVKFCTASTDFITFSLYYATMFHQECAEKFRKFLFVRSNGYQIPNDNPQRSHSLHGRIQGENYIQDVP